MHDACALVGERSNGVADQIVHQDQTGGSDRLGGLDGQELRIAGAGPHQGDSSVFHSCPVNCIMCWTCCVIGAGTGVDPASTCRI